MDSAEIVNTSYELMNSYKRHTRIPADELENVHDHILKLEELATSNHAAGEAFRMVDNLCDREWPVYKRVHLFKMIQTMNNSDQAYITFLPELIAVLNEIKGLNSSLENSETLDRKSFNYIVFYLASAKMSLSNAARIGIFNKMILTEMIKSLSTLKIYRESDLKKELTLLCSPNFEHMDFVHRWYFDY